MKLVETLIFEVWSRKPMYDDEAKTPTGSVKNWHDVMGVKPADIAAAMVEAKKLASYKKLLTSFTAKESPKLLKNGTFQFANDKNMYSVYGNGVIRQESNNRKGMNHYITRLKAPKPALVHGSPVKSLIKIYDNAFKELASKKLSENLIESQSAVVAKVFSLLDMTHPTEQDREHMASDIERKTEEGWTPEEIAAFMRNMEEVNPDLSEDRALKNMKKISDAVKTRLGK